MRISSSDDNTTRHTRLPEGPARALNHFYDPRNNLNYATRDVGCRVEPPRRAAADSPRLSVNRHDIRARHVRARAPDFASRRGVPACRRRARTVGHYYAQAPDVMACQSNPDPPDRPSTQTG